MRKNDKIERKKEEIFRDLEKMTKQQDREIERE